MKMAYCRFFDDPPTCYSVAEDTYIVSQGTIATGGEGSKEESIKRWNWIIKEIRRLKITIQELLDDWRVGEDWEDFFGRKESDRRRLQCRKT